MSEDAYPSEDDIAGLANLEAAVFGGVDGKSAKELAQGVFNRNAISAAMTISNMALHASNENTRLRAAQYVTDRVLGPLNQANPIGAVDDALMAAVNEFQNAVDAEKNKPY